MGYRVFDDREKILHNSRGRLTIVLPVEDSVTADFSIAEYMGSRRVSKPEYFSCSKEDDRIREFCFRRNIWVHRSVVKAYDTLTENQGRRRRKV